jgi:hypothetical protein
MLAYVIVVAVVGGFVALGWFVGCRMAGAWESNGHRGARRG